MEKQTMRERLDAYAGAQYDVVPEVLPFSHEEYEIYRHADTGKWFAVFIVKERKAFGLEGDGRAEIVCLKPQDALTADFLFHQPGYLRGYPSRGWRWISVLLDGSVPFEEICRHLDESYRATGTKVKNKKTPLMERKLRRPE